MPQIGTGQKHAHFEAMAAAVSLLSPHHRRSFILIGGTALLTLGSTRRTQDVDFAVTVPALHAWYTAASNDSRFHRDGMESWAYRCESGIVIPFEFLLQGGGFVPVIRRTELVGGAVAEGVLRASLGELAIMKARAWEGRADEKDLEDFGFVVEKMNGLGEGFEGLDLHVKSVEGDELGDLEVLKAVGQEIGGRTQALLLEMLRSCETEAIEHS